MTLPDFWNNQEAANRILREIKYLKSCVEPLEKSEKQLKDVKDLLDMTREDQEFSQHLEEELKNLENEVGVLETQAFLSGEFDRNNAILSINAGAGGTESCDWASMLLRMYTRWADDHKFQVTMVDNLSGEGAGIKNAGRINSLRALSANISFPDCSSRYLCNIK